MSLLKKIADAFAPANQSTPSPAAPKRGRRGVTSDDASSTGISLELKRPIFPLEIVGESNYQKEIKRIAAATASSEEPGVFTAVLVREPDNPYDPDAVAVYADGGSQVGYLAREEAAAISEFLDAIARRGYRAYCTGRIAGGTSRKKHRGIWLNMDQPTRVWYQAKHWLPKEPTVSQKGSLAP